MRSVSSRAGTLGRLIIIKTTSMKKSAKKEPEPIFGQPVGIPNYTDGILTDAIKKRRVIDNSTNEVPVVSPDVIDLDGTLNP